MNFRYFTPRVGKEVSYAKRMKQLKRIQTSLIPADEIKNLHCVVEEITKILNSVTPVIKINFEMELHLLTEREKFLKILNELCNIEGEDELSVDELVTYILLIDKKTEAENLGLNDLNKEKSKLRQFLKFEIADELAYNTAILNVVKELTQYQTLIEPIDTVFREKLNRGELKADAAPIKTQLEKIKSLLFCFKPNYMYKLTEISLLNNITAEIDHLQQRINLLEIELDSTDTEEQEFALWEEIDTLKRMLLQLREKEVTLADKINIPKEEVKFPNLDELKTAVDVFQKNPVYAILVSEAEKKKEKISNAEKHHQQLLAHRETLLAEIKTSDPDEYKEILDSIALEEEEKALDEKLDHTVTTLPDYQAMERSKSQLVIDLNVLIKTMQNFLQRNAYKFNEVDTALDSLINLLLVLSKMSNKNVNLIEKIEEARNVLLEIIKPIQVYCKELPIQSLITILLQLDSKLKHILQIPIQRLRPFIDEHYQKFLKSPLGCHFSHSIMIPTSLLFFKETSNDALTPEQEKLIKHQSLLKKISPLERLAISLPQTEFNQFLVTLATQSPDKPNTVMPACF